MQGARLRYARGDDYRAREDSEHAARPCDRAVRLVRPRPRGARARHHRSPPPAELAEIDAAVHIFKASGRSLAAISPEDFPLPAFGDALRRLGAELLEGRGFFMLRGFPVDDYTREEQAIAYMGIGAYFGRPRSQNAKGHLLGHVKDLGPRHRRPGGSLLPDEPPARVPHRLDRRGRPLVPQDRAHRAARASSSPRARSTTRSSRAGRICCRRCSSRLRPTAAARCRRE